MPGVTPENERPREHPPGWYWLFAFPIATGARYLLKPDGLSRLAGFAWWVGSLVVAIVMLWIVWIIGTRLRSS